MCQLAFFLLLLLQAANPSEAGVYYQGSADWVQLKPAPIVRMKPKGLGMFMETEGYTSLGTNIVCRGGKAALRIDSSKPVFFVRGTGSSQDVLIVRLTQAKDARTVRGSSVNISVENKDGFKKGDIRKVAVTEYPDHSFSIAPVKDLNPGEYLLVFGSTASGFDFGIDKKK
jgi:hypothetical protein